MPSPGVNPTAPRSTIRYPGWPAGRAISRSRSLNSAAASAPWKASSKASPTRRHRRRSRWPPRSKSFRGWSGSLPILLPAMRRRLVASAAPLVLRRRRPPPPPPPRAGPPPGGGEPAAPAGPALPQIAAFAGLANDVIIAAVRGAIDAQRIDLHLQPIVTLPQRKVRYYEALSRLNAGSGELVTAEDFLPYAEAASLLPKLDRLSVFRCVQIVRRLSLKNREIGLFCNVSASALTDAGFPQLLEFIEANRALAPSLMFEFTQNAIRNMGRMEHEALAAIAERGFRFSMDNLTDLRVEPRELTARGFRFVKASAALLLNRVASATSNIHPADFSDLLGRFGIDLIAERIESESMVVDLLDYDVRFGQGFLFSPPRPVRAEALQAGLGDPGKNAEEPAAGKPPGGDAPAARTSAIAQLARAAGCS